MKQKLFALASLSILALATGCGKSEDQPAASTAAVGVTCPAGTVNYNNTCVTSQYGNPTGQPGWNGQYNSSLPPGGGLSGCGGFYWNNGYSYTNGCYNQPVYHYWWVSPSGIIWYW